MTYLCPRPCQNSQIKRLGTRKQQQQKYAQTFDSFMNLEELFALSLLRYLICNCICNRSISPSH